MSKKNVFVVGLDDFNLKKMKLTPEASDCEFHPALYISEIREIEQFDMATLVDTAVKRMEEFPGKIDAVVAYYDFPATDILPILAERFGLPGPSLESVFKCEHKYWSRLEQQKVIPDHIPVFRAFDPFDPHAFEKLNMLPPFWIKPIRSFRSFLAYRINGEIDFVTNIEEVKEQIDYLARPYRYFLENYPVPAEIAEMEESCIAESMLEGSQCTLEGYVLHGDVVIYGIVDSVREADRSSFARYEYPSFLPQEIQFRMADVARRVIKQIGLNNSPFNAEFFYNSTLNEVFLLEINPRISQSHADIFEKVHGVSHLSIMLQIALGKRPAPLDTKGPFQVAANCMIRTYESGKLIRVPFQEEITSIENDIPGTVIKLLVKEGQHLNNLQLQDSYSFELANVFIGGRDRLELLERYNQVLDKLNFDVERDEETVIS
ncbi:MAG: acetyl-CoA carboxylase biotin carboxylase subunit family protein [Archaeoglobaceae archaeon]